MGFIETVFPDGSPVDKAAVRTDDRSGHRRNIGEPSLIQGDNWSGQSAGFYVRSLQTPFDLDTSDKITADDGTNTIVDTAGNRFKRVTAFVTDLIGSTAEAIAAVNNSKFMTPFLTLQTIINRCIKVANVRGYGATGVAADDTQAFRDAIATGFTVYMPPGQYGITGTLEFTTPGQRMYGEGRDRTFLRITPDFVGVNGVLFSNCTPGAFGPQFEDFTIQFVQPDVDNLAAMNAYPPAIVNRTNPFMIVKKLAIYSGIIGIDLKAPSAPSAGGTIIEDVWLATYNYGVDIDGVYDTVRIDKLHFWPFATTANNRIAFAAATNIGIRSARCDGLFISNSMLITGLSTAVNLYVSAQGATFGNISNTGFDSGKGIVMEGGVMNVSSSYFTVGITGAWGVRNVGGILNISSSWFLGAVAGVELATVGTSADARLGISSSYFDTQGHDIISVHSEAGNLQLHGNEFTRNTNTAYGSPTIFIVSGQATIVGNRSTAKGAGSGSFIQALVDANHKIALNSPGGYGISNAGTSGGFWAGNN